MRVSLSGVKPHIFCSAAMFIFISIIVLERNQLARALLLVPVLMLFVAFEILYGIELASAPKKKPENTEMKSN